MIRRHPAIKAVGTVLGSMGIVACLASMILVWIAGDRVGRVTESLFASADRSLVAVRQRVLQTHERVADAKITAADVEKTLRDWTRREVGERLVSKSGAAEKTKKVASTLQQADLWLEVAESSTALFGELLAVAVVENPRTSTSIDHLSGEITDLRTELRQARQFIDSLNERIDSSDEKSLSQRVEQAAQLAVRVVATLGSVDSRLGKLEERLSAAKERLHDLDASAQRWIFVATIGATLLVLWMMVGQAALCRLAWHGPGRPQL